MLLASSPTGFSAKRDSCPNTMQITRRRCIAGYNAKNSCPLLNRLLARSGLFATPRSRRKSNPSCLSFGISSGSAAVGKPEEAEDRGRDLWRKPAIRNNHKEWNPSTPIEFGKKNRRYRASPDSTSKTLTKYKSSNGNLREGWEPSLTSTVQGALTTPTFASFLPVKSSSRNGTYMKRWFTSSEGLAPLLFGKRKVGSRRSNGRRAAFSPFL